MVASAQVYQVQTIIAIPASIMETGAAHRAARRPISELKIIRTNHQDTPTQRNAKSAAGKKDYRLRPRIERMKPGILPRQT
jgi:hypothetical protein